MLIFKFLAAGGVGPFSGFAWPQPPGPEPGEWVAALSTAPAPFRDTVRGCTSGQIAYWVNAELWEFELEDPESPAERTVAGRRGRLLRRVEGWTEELQHEYVRECVSRAEMHAEGSGNERDVVVAARSAEKLAHKGVAMAGYIAAHAAGIRTEVSSEGDYEKGRAIEREWQSAWLAERLGTASA